MLKNCFVLLLSASLFACATQSPPSTLRDYIEPDPATTPTAKFRIAKADDAMVDIKYHPESDQMFCLKMSGSKLFPKQDHYVNTNLKNSMSSKIGMTDTGKAGHEYYIPTNTKGLTLSVNSTSRQNNYNFYCNQAFLFFPETGKEYELTVSLDIVKYELNSCALELSEVNPLDRDINGKLNYKKVNTLPVAYTGSTLWKNMCQSATTK